MSLASLSNVLRCRSSRTAKPAYVITVTCRVKGSFVPARNSVIGVTLE
ncbi:hypothetical protein FB461_2137 [Rarobacter faecitabidus]|uniref:Uncharacterized protein n=1 Tax=Rarobacter faecitabidus TaxID=13243 RepID=A0A542ZAN9_RARFA|nr:hypothetical protein FB461_2137 [Rarobacter faecitabidus]